MSASRELVVRVTATAAIVSVCLTLGACAHGSSEAAGDVDRLARNFIQTLSEKDVAAFQKAAKDDLPMFHFGAGSRVREMYFGPHGGGREALCKPDVYCDVDRESMRIVERSWELLRSGG